jgi:hypothetical protein
MLDLVPDNEHSEVIEGWPVTVDQTPEVTAHEAQHHLSILLSGSSYQRDVEAPRSRR